MLASVPLLPWISLNGLSRGLGLMAQRKIQLALGLDHTSGRHESMVPALNFATILNVYIVPPELL